MSISRLDPGKRYSEAVIHGNTVYLAGQVSFNLVLLVDFGRLLMMWGKKNQASSQSLFCKFGNWGPDGANSCCDWQASCKIQHKQRSFALSNSLSSRFVCNCNELTSKICPIMLAWTKSGMLGLARDLLLQELVFRLSWRTLHSGWRLW